MPKVSIVSFVYNCEEYIAEAMDSMLQQTFNDFEYLIVNDGSTDKTGEIIDSYSDKRIRSIHLAENKGRPVARNVALDALMTANDSEYFAWMGGDDISVPNRLEKQVTFLDTHKDISVVGGAMACFQGNNAHIRMPRHHDAIKATAIWQNPIFDGTTCIRRKDMERYGLRFHEELRRVQDYAYYVDMLFGTPLKAVNMPDILLRYRYEKRATTARYHVKAVAYLLQHLGFAEELYKNSRICYMHTILSRSSFEGAEDLTDNMPEPTLLELIAWVNEVYHAALRRNDIAMKHFCHITQYKVETLLLQSKNALDAFRAYIKLPVAQGHDLPRLLKGIKQFEEKNF